jgi:hypothetical protein
LKEKAIMPEEMTNDQASMTNGASDAAPAPAVKPNPKHDDAVFVFQACLGVSKVEAEKRAKQLTDEQFAAVAKAYKEKDRVAIVNLWAPSEQKPKAESGKPEEASPAPSP